MMFCKGHLAHCKSCDLSQVEEQKRREKEKKKAEQAAQQVR